MPKKENFTHRSPVRFTHTDPAGYVFFPRFFEMFQAAVEDWFNLELKVDYAGLVLDRGLGFPTAHTECTFIKPCHLGEILEVSVGLKKVGRSSITIEFICFVAEEERLRAQSVLVLIGLENGKSTPIPEDLRERFKDYQSKD